MTAPGAYWPRPWTCEDGGPRRLGAPQGQPGLAIAPGERLELAAVRDAAATGMVIRREPGELFALRHELPRRAQGPSVRSWVERLDPLTLTPLAVSPRLPGGPFWPGGMAAHACGDLHVVLGHWAHRLSPSLDVLASHRLPVERPHNSFVVLDGGELVMKDCDAPAGVTPATLSSLDPLTLLPVAPPLALPEPSIARLSCDGERVIAVGTTRVFRIALDRAAGRLVVDDVWRPRYGPEPGRSYGWDPVLSDDHVFWMDNGRNATDATMLASGSSPGPVRLWWARHDDGATRSVEVSGLPYGTQSNPPGWDPVGRVVVGYDAGNAVLRAWRMTDGDLEPLWRRDGFAHAGHLILYPDTRELIVQDWQDRPPPPRIRAAIRPVFGALARMPAARRAAVRIGRGDRLVVLDLDTGAEKASCAVPSATQSYLFPAPGFGRDIYHQSLTTIARAVVVGG